MSVLVCGCSIYRSEIVFCALHSAAAEMRDLLQLHDDYSTLPSPMYRKKYPDAPGSYELMQRRRKLLAKVNK
jgi:hypothetical protein